MESLNKGIRIDNFHPHTVTGKIDDSFKKIIVTKDIVPASYDESGVLTLSIYDFLLNPNALSE